MSEHHGIQTISDQHGNPAFVVIPYQDYLSMKNSVKVPNEIIQKMTTQHITAVRAWREYIGLTQAEIAKRMGISQPAYSQIENKATVRRGRQQKIANALGILPSQLEI